MNNHGLRTSVHSYPAAFGLETIMLGALIYGYRYRYRPLQKRYVRQQKAADGEDVVKNRQAHDTQHHQRHECHITVAVIEVTVLLGHSAG